MVLEVDGVNLVPFTAFGGIRWQRADVDGPNAGRMLDGSMIRDRVAVKYRFDVTCRPLTGAELATVMQAVEPEYVTVEFTDPMTNTVRSAQFYSNNIPATYAIRRKDGTEYWSGVTFPLIQR